MGHWAELDAGSHVKRVIVIKEAELDTGNWGDKSNWVKTSYNTRNGKHYKPKEHQDFQDESEDQSKAIGYRFASLRMYYCKIHKVFYDKWYYDSWTLDTTDFLEKPPIPKPSISEGVDYKWDEEAYQKDNTKGWVLSL